MPRNRRGFGSIRALPSKRYQAAYTGPDGRRYKASTTFGARMDAEGWLSRRRSEITDGVWTPGSTAAPKVTTLGEYAESWLRRRDLKPRTRAHYGAILHHHILPTFDTMPIKNITPAAVADWHHDLAKTTGPTYRAHAYALLRTVCKTAVDEDELTVSPCRIRGAGSSRRVKKIQPASLPQLEELVAAMPEHLRVMTLLAAWCGLRFGELTELRRKDVDLKNGTLHVRRAIVRVGGEVIVGVPKSSAGVRDVAIPPHLLPALKEHLSDAMGSGRDALLFPAQDGRHLPQSTLSGHFSKARQAAGRPDLRWHDLRHTGAVLAASTGATLAELMARLGHSTPSAALRYQHAAQGRDAQIAAALSALVTTQLEISPPACR